MPVRTISLDYIFSNIVKRRMPTGEAMPSLYGQLSKKAVENLFPDIWTCNGKF